MQPIRSGVSWREHSTGSLDSTTTRMRPCPAGRSFDRLDSVNAEDAEFDRSQLSKNAKARHVRRGLVQELWPHLLQQKEDEQRVSALTAYVLVVCPTV